MARHKLYLTGADVVSTAAIHAGCDFFAGYPITPASSILANMLEGLRDTGGIGLQAEDEISAISMCIAAAMAGRRAMTATSGPGMSLYSESLGLAQMAEVPLVVVDAQRMGPATGGATTHAEGDVQFARWPTAGGYPLVVYAPCDLATTYRLTLKAFDTAERLRTPVILLTSKNLVMTAETIAEEDFAPVPVSARRRDPKVRLPYVTGAPEDVPSFLAFGEELTRFTTSIHDERGVITESPTKAAAKLEHLLRKIESREDELAEVTHLTGEGDTAIVCYGAAARASRAAHKLLAQRGSSTALVIVHTLSPLPARRLTQALAGVRRVVVPELNPGLLRPEVERWAPKAEVRGLVRLDGGVISPQAIADAVSAP